MGKVNKEPHELLPGEYSKWHDAYYGVPPNTDLVANLSAHKIEEHDDGTISVTPSILVGDNHVSWHGYLTKGEWKQC